MKLEHIVALALITAAGLPVTAIAQCATGVDTGGGNCIPPEQLGVAGNNASANAPHPVWRDAWGAVVVDKNTGTTGVSTNEQSRSAAIDVAMRKCQSEKGANSCKVVTSYGNSCIAVASGSNAFTSANDRELDKAKTMALDHCSQLTDSCQVFYSACSVPTRIQ